jgi:GT2 family glycosyltransferase
MSEASIDPDHPFLVGGSMGIIRETFFELGGFEEELGPGALGPGGEDLLLTYRLQAAGGTIRFVKDVVVLHCPDEAKLERAALAARRVSEAASDAWLAYHWFGRSIRNARVKAWILSLLSRFSVEPRRSCYKARARWHEQMAVEQRRPRRYPR